jgi:hypothetical protein
VHNIKAAHEALESGASEMTRGRKISISIAATLVVLAGAALIFGNLQMRVSAFYLGIPQPQHSVAVDRDIMVKMSDGVRLAADIYRPNSPGKYPVVITRTPYSKDNTHHRYAFAGKLFASQGFVFVVQDVRGKYKSDGEYYPYANEGVDGHETFEWAGAQEWSSGKVGAYGFSYFGSTQWLSAPYQSKYLQAMVPIVTSQNIYPRWIYNGIFRFNDILFWHYGNSCKTDRKIGDIDSEKAIRGLPLIKADDAMGLDVLPYNDWISHPTPDDYWERLRVDNKVDRILAPALLIGGWYDYYLELMFDDYNRMITQGGSKEARQSRIIIGPWTHESVSKFDDVDFGKDADFTYQIRTILDWYRYRLKGEQKGAFESGPITIFVMGKNEWRTEKEWPLARMQFTKYYLHSGGKANTAQGDGILDLTPPTEESADHFTYDPANPVPSIGGTSIYGNAKPGPRDQREIEKRTDVLVYSTPRLERDIEITGPVEAVLYASSTAKDTDFSAKLLDVYPDGKAINLRSGMVRARYRESLVEPAFLEPGIIYQFQFPVGATSNLFKKGHRVRIEISSSHFPEFGRNLNNGGDIGTSSEIVKADQTLYHDEIHPSYVLLPVIPEEE